MTAWKEKNETLILCEGYHDRAFWAGCVTHAFGGKDGREAVASATAKPDGALPKKTQLLDPWGQRVADGAFACISSSGRYIRINPCNGYAGILPALRVRINLAGQKPLRSVIVGVDADTLSNGTGNSPITAQGLRDFLAVAPPEPLGPVITLNLGQVIVPVALVHWKAGRKPENGSPAKGCLEQLVCAAVAAVYPKRLPTIASWLASRTDPPPKAQQEKEIALSLVAGWHAHQGVEGFYRSIWADDAIRASLIEQLKHTGQWSGLERALAEE